MEFVDLKAAEEFSPQHHVHKSLTATPHSDISIACWEPGQRSPIHCHPGADEIYHVIGAAVSSTTARPSASWSPATR
jgi:quercetin dioxygenase-like cupin family protein